MSSHIPRHLPVGTPANRTRPALGAILVSAVVLACTGTGCGMVTAVTNPSAAFAIQEPANLGVVVRRAEIARATSTEVDRLLGATPLADDSAWLEQVALKQEAAKARMEASANDSVYFGAQARIVPAEAWAHELAGVCSDGSAHPNLVAATGPDVAKRYAELVAERKALAKLKSAAALEEKALDADGITAAQKAEHEKKLAALEADADKLEASTDTKLGALVDALKKPSPAAGPLKDKLRTAVANLSAAVKDARNANSAAVLGYPLALRTLPTDVQKAAPRFVADVIEDKTGTRPDTGGLKPEVKLDGTDVKLTLNGVSTEQLGKLSLSDVVAETTTRLSAYGKLAATVPVYASETEDMLSLQEKLLEAYLEGLGGGKGVDLSGIAVQSAAPGSPPGKPAAKPEGAKGHRWPGGLLIVSACTPSKGDDTPVVAAAPVPGPTGAAEEPAKTAEAKQPETAEPAPETPPKEAPSKETPGKIEPAAAEPTSSSSPLRTVGWISLGTGVAGLGVGAVFGILAAGKHGDLNTSCNGSSCPPALHSDVDQYRTFGTVSTVALIGGGAAAALGVVLVVSAPSAPTGEQARLRVSPYVGPGVAGALGRF